MFRSFFSLSSLTVASRLSGFIKVAAFAAFFGRSSESDLFLAAMLLPDLMYKFISEGLLSSAAVPMFVEKKDDLDDSNKAFWNIFSLITIFAVFLAVVLTVFSQNICKFIAPGFSNEMIQEMSILWSIMSVYLIFGLQSGFMTAFLNSMEIFALPAVGPLLINFVVIGTILFARGGNVRHISYALVFGSLIQMIWLMYLSLKNGISFKYLRELLAPFSKCSKEFLKEVIPVAGWIFLLPFIPVYERYLLSMQAVGSVSTIDYVIKIFNLPLGIISISAARVIFPYMSRLKGDAKVSFLYRSLITVTVVLVPIIFAMVIGAEKIVEIVLKRGKFNLEDTIVAGKLLGSYIPALLPLTLSLILNRYCFSEKDFKTPFFAGIIAIISQFFAGSRFVEEFGPTGIGYAAIVAYSSQMVAILLIRAIKKVPAKLKAGTL